MKHIKIYESFSGIPDQFKTPSAKALSAMDSFLQNSTAEKQWDRSQISSYFNCPECDTWDDVEVKEPRKFHLAWLLAMKFMLDYDFSFQDVIDEWLF